MVLPAPVLPTMAVVVPGRGGEGDVAEHRLLGARVVEADAAQLERAVARAASRTGSAGGTTRRLGVEHLLDAAAGRPTARGTIDSVNVAITTDIRIWTR